MPVTRTTLLAGPATATFAGRTFFAQDGIVVTPALELAAVDSDAQGVLDATVSGAPVTIRFTPSVLFADLIALYPHLQGSPGASLFGATDSSLVLTAANGVRLTFSAVAIIGMPDLHLTSRTPAVSSMVAGAVTFLALGARDLPITAANRVVTIDTTDELPVWPDWTPQLTDDYAVTWGNAPWINLRSQDGVRVRFAIKTKPVMSDANALLDLTLERLEIEARFIPVTSGGPGEANLVAALQVQGTLPGRLLSDGAQTLEIAGEHLVVQLPLAQLTRGELTFDGVKSRVGELVFVAERALVGSTEALVRLMEGEA